MSESGATTLSTAGDMLKPENCNSLDILVEEAEHVQSQPDTTWKRQICRATMSGDWVKASLYDETHPNWFRIPLTEDGDTALHIAASMEQTHFVERLVERMTTQDVEILNADGNTAFCMAAISGNVKIATILLHKNTGLIWIRGPQDMLPIELASSVDQPRMVKFLFKRTRHDIPTNLSFKNIVRLFFLALTHNIYSVASMLLDKYPKLATAENYKGGHQKSENDKGLTALELLAQLSFDQNAPGYRHILSSLTKHMEKEEFANSARISDAMFDAAKSGNTMILEFILKCNPNLLMRVNSKKQSLLHIAILSRQAPVFRQILSMGAYKNAILHKVDSEGNNVLHLAGKLAAEERFGSPIHQVLIRSEELWFKEVEKIVPPALKTMKNNEGWTPQQLFYREHKYLSEKAISELHGVANNFLVVATLIVTLGITGALTIRTNPKIEGATPVFKQETWYIIFLVSVAVGVCYSAVSMLLFTSVILPSIGKREPGYVTTLLIRTACGYLLFYASVAIIGTLSVVSGAALVYNFFPKWVFLLIVILISTAVISSVVIYYYSLNLFFTLILSFWKVEDVRILSMMGIKLVPLYDKAL